MADLRRRGKICPRAQLTQVFEKGLWPEPPKFRELIDRGPLILRGFGNNLPLVRTFDSDDRLKQESLPTKLHVKVSEKKPASEGAPWEFHNCRTTTMTLGSFLAEQSYQKPNTSASYLTAYPKKDYNVASVDANRKSAYSNAFDPFDGPLRRVLPRIVEAAELEGDADSPPSGNGSEETAEKCGALDLDPEQRFLRLCSVLHESGHTCRNIAFWMSGTTVSTPLHYDEYMTVAVLAGDGEKEWFLAPPEATNAVRSCRRFAAGEKQHTSGFKPWEASIARCEGGGADAAAAAAAPSQASAAATAASITTAAVAPAAKATATAAAAAAAEVSEREEDAAAAGWFHAVTVRRGDVLVVPPKWWHAVVTRGRCLAATWWWTPQDKRRVAELELEAGEGGGAGAAGGGGGGGGGTDLLSGKWTCKSCSTANEASTYGGPGGLQEGQRPSCTFCCHIRGGTDHEWRCKFCTRDNQTAVTHEGFCKRAQCATCGVVRGEDVPVVSEEEVRETVRLDALHSERMRKKKKQKKAAGGSASSSSSSSRKRAPQQQRASEGSQEESLERSGVGAVVGENAKRPRGGQSPSASAKDKKCGPVAGAWACPTCTFHNEDDTSGECAMCQGDRPPETLPPIS